MNVSTGRLTKEAKNINDNPPFGISAAPVDPKNVHKWKAIITGPAGTPYANGVFELEIICEDTYPFTPPKIRFVTPIFHCNVGVGGRICLDVLDSKWSPALNISTILLSISSLLNDPNPNDPLRREAADLFTENKEEYELRARMETAQYAM